MTSNFQTAFNKLESAIDNLNHLISEKTKQKTVEEFALALEKLNTATAELTETQPTMEERQKLISLTASLDSLTKKAEKADAKTRTSLQGLAKRIQAQNSYKKTGENK